MEYRYTIWYAYRRADSFCGKSKILRRVRLERIGLTTHRLDYSTEASENADFVVTRQHLEEWESHNGQIEPGTFVALRTDWSKRWPDIDQFENKDANGNQHLPGWGLDALKFLIEERGVKSIGHETFDTDASVDTAKTEIL